MAFDAPHRRVVELDGPPLPIACPNENTPADLLHPRVWLDPTHEDMSMCPYCGTVYRIKPGPDAKTK